MHNTPLLFRLAELLRAAAAVPNFNPAVEQVDPGSEWRAVAEAAIAEFDSKGYQADEPIFMLRGRDQLAADTVSHWVAKGFLMSVNPDKLTEAQAIAARMSAFPGRRMPT